MWRFISLVTLFPCSISFAQSQKILKLHEPKEVFQYADSFSPYAKIASSQSEQAYWKIKQARSLWSPKIQAFANADHYPILMAQVVPESFFGGSASSYRTIRFGLPLATSAGAEISIPLLDLELWNRAEKIKIQSELSQIQAKQYHYAFHKLLNQSVSQYVLNDQLEKIAIENKVSGDNLKYIILLKDSVGVANPTDIPEVHIALLSIQQQIQEFHQAKLIALSYIKHYLGLNPSDSLLLAFNADTYFNTLDHKRNLNPSLHIAEWQLNKKAFQYLQKETQFAAWPKLYLSGRYTHQIQWDNVTHSGIDFNYSAISLKLDVPLFRGFHQKYQLKAAKETQKEIAYKTSAEIEKIQLKEHELMKNIALAQEKNETLIQTLALSQELFDKLMLQYEQGLTEFHLVNKAFMDLQNHKMNHYLNLQKIQSLTFELDHL